MPRHGVPSPWMETHFCSADELAHERPGTLLEGVADEGEGAGAVAKVEQLLQQQQAVRAPMSLNRRRHG